MYADYIHVLVLLLAGCGLVAFTLILGSLIRPSRSGSEGLEPYECGEEPIGDARVRFDIRYYTVALVYLVFAVETALLLPWARVLKTAFAEPGIGGVALFEGAIFVLILVVGLVYVYAKGDLDWVKAYRDEHGLHTRPGAESKGAGVS